MIFFVFWPFPLSLFFSVTAVLLVVLFVIHTYAKGRLRVVTRFLIPLISVVSFIGFITYITTTLMRSCEPEATQTVVLAIILFVVLLIVLFCTMGKKRL